MGHPSAQLESSLLSSLAISFTHPSILLLKMKTSCLIASLLVVGASAFAPAKQSVASTSLSGYKEDVGATAPLGFFDPLNLSNDSTDQETYDRMRAAEVRHGRGVQTRQHERVVRSQMFSASPRPPSTPYRTHTVGRYGTRNT